MSEPIHIISLGAGVQSSTMALMAAAGEITPMPKCSIFADTQDEPASVYAWLAWLEKQLPFPVHRVTRGKLSEKSTELRKSKGGKFYTKHAPPAFITDSNGRSGLLMRQCTGDFKIDPIHKKIRELMGKSHVIQWIGISVDEAHRMKPAGKRYITNQWPLIDAGMSRKDCLEWMRAKRFPEPPRSSCVFCPYHSNKEWQRIKTNDPAGFADAVAYEKDLQLTMSQVSGFRGTPFLHRSAVPLDQVNFREPGGQMDMFGNECEGVCGV